MLYNRPGSIPRWKEEVALPNFSLSSLYCLTPSFFWFYVQHLARDTNEVAKLREEVTRARAIVIMARGPCRPGGKDGPTEGHPAGD
jgi:hypothetical protein